MANLIGGGINQIPTNGLLGNLAFQDKAFVSVDKIGIGTTAVDTGTANQSLQNYGGAYITGNVGLGTTNPTSTLQVAGTFYNSGIGTFANGNTTYGTTSASSLELGLNNTNNAGTLKLWGATSNAYGIIQATSSNLHIDTVVGATYLNYYDGDFISFGTGASGESARFTGSTGTLTLGTVTPTGTASQLLQVTGGAYFAGAVGIGTTNPSTSLHVQGNTWLNNSSGDTQTRAQVLTASFAPGGNFSPGADPGDALRNTTFAVKGSTRPAIITLRNIDNSNAFYDLIADGSSNSFYIQRPGTSPALTIRNDNNIGIGTTNPSNTLTVYGTQSDTTPILALLSGNQQVGFNNGAQIAFGYDGTTTYQHFIQTRHNSGNSNNAIDFYVSDGTQNNTLTSGSVHTMSLVSGSVGINSTAPTSKLDVVGNAKFTGIVTATSFVKSGGTSSEFLKADGSVDTNTYLTSYTETDTLNSVTGRGNSTANGISVGILTATSGNFSGIITSSGANISGIVTASKIGIGTTNATEALTVSGKIQINQNSTSDNRLIFRGQPSSSYRWNIDNYGSSNEFRIFREDDATSANGSVAVSISTTGTVTATKFSGDGSLLTGIAAAGSGVVVQNQDSTVGTANTLNFSTNLTASFASGTATISLSNNPSITGILTADQVYTSNNGNGTNVRIGDDFWVGDINVANTTRFSGAQDSTKAFVVFGSSDAVALGRTGTGPLYYGGNFNVAGVSSATSFSGSGTNLTGIVTSIVAGTNITVSGSTGQVTINSTATGGGAALDILEVMLFA